MIPAYLLLPLAFLLHPPFPTQQVFTAGPNLILLCPGLLTATDVSGHRPAQETTSGFTSREDKAELEVMPPLQAPQASYGLKRDEAK